MVGMNYEEIVAKICQEKGVSKDEVLAKIQEKLNQLSDLISKEGAAHIVANEYGVKVYEATFGPKEIKIKDLNSTLKNIVISAKVINIFEIREFKTSTREGRVANLIIGDETGSCRLVLWDEKHLKEVEVGKLKQDDIIKISNGYARENRGSNEIHLGGNGVLEINPTGIKIDSVQSQTSERKYIKDLEEGKTATVIGTVVQIFEPRFYDSCPDCGKKVELGEQGYVCPNHGTVESKPQGILNIVFDDGTDNIRIVCFRDNINKVLDIEDVTTLQDNPDKFREVQRNVAGKQLKIEGRVNRNDFFDRLEMVAFSVVEADPKELALELKDK